MSRVLLINPPKKMPLLDWTMRYPPLGLMSIAAVLDGHEVEILDMKAEKTRRKELPRRLGSVDIVGITVLTPSFDSALEICRIAGECGALTVLGGVHPTLMPQVVAYPEVDIVVRGEGELTFREIADGRPLGSIPGISYVSGSTVVHNPDRPHVDLNTLPATAEGSRCREQEKIQGIQPDTGRAEHRSRLSLQVQLLLRAQGMERLQGAFAHRSSQRNKTDGQDRDSEHSR